MIRSFRAKSRNAKYSARARFSTSLETNGGWGFDLKSSDSGLLAVDGAPRADRAALEARWLELTRVILPGLAHVRRWPVATDHCFQRILLDAATGGIWYRAIARRPAYRGASDAQLALAVALADQVAAGQADLARLNAQSLAWRRAG